MKSPCFEVYLNGELVCKAGVRERGSLGVHLDWVTWEAEPFERFTLGIAGYVSETNTSLRWTQEQIKPGDEIKILITNSDDFTEGTPPPPEDGETRLKRKIWAYNEMKKWITPYL